MASEVAEVMEPALDAASEAILEGVDGVVEVVEVVRNNPIALATVGVVSLFAGVGVGYYVARKRLRDHYDTIASFEIAEAKQFYASVYKTDEDGAVLTPQDVFADRHGAIEAAEAMQSYRGLDVDEEGYVEIEPGILVDAEDEAQLQKIESNYVPKPSVNDVPQNVFVDPKFDLAEEVKYRTTDKPYIISSEEFFESVKDYENQSLTYFVEDDTLINERDEPIREVDQMVGDDHLVRFGHGSRDMNIVYVRNDRLELDFEIVKADGSYLQAVLGISSQGNVSKPDPLEARRAARHGDG